MNQIDFLRDLQPLAAPLYRLALRLLQVQVDAEDAVQETLLRAWTLREELALKQNPQAFCMTICRNICLDALEKSERRNASLEENDAQAAQIPTESADAPLLKKERRLLVRQALAQLPPTLRTAIQLRDIEELTYQEAADAMGLTLTNFKVTLFRARRALAESLKGRI